MSLLDQLAAFANASLPDGINWAEQAQAYGSREGSVAAYRDDSSGKAGYIAELYTARSAVTNGLSRIGIDARANYDAWQAARAQSKADIEASGTELTRALASNAAQLADPVQFDKEALRDFLSMYAALLESQLEVHATKFVFELGGTDAQVADDADALVRKYKQLAYLLDSGALGALLPARSSTLVGYAHLIVLGVGVLLLVAIIAGAIVYGQYLQGSIAAAKEACLKMIDAGRADASGFCGKLVPKPLIEPINVNAATSSLAFYAVIGVVALGGLYIFANRKG
jgi:hypothetical protein